MPVRALLDAPLRFGLLVGLVFGLENLVLAWLYPLEDDTPSVLLRFYGPMFLVWAITSFRAARRSGRIFSGVTAGVAIALGTFCVLDLLVILRANLLLNELTGRSDWQGLMRRFDASGLHNLRTFVNFDYVKGAPLKIGVASTVGAVIGTIGGSFGRVAHERQGVTV